MHGSVMPTSFIGMLQWYFEMTLGSKTKLNGDFIWASIIYGKTNVSIKRYAVMETFS